MSIDNMSLLKAGEYTPDARAAAASAASC